MNIATSFSALFSSYPFNLIFTIFVAIALIVSIVSLIISLRAKNRISQLLNGKNSKDIDEVLMRIYKNISSLDQFRTKILADISVMNTKISRSAQSIETVRFNPFKGTGSGGNQSFATAILNENGDGVILSSLYSSDRVSIFAKPILKLESTYELTEEEIQALHAAATKLGL